jgi:hypothetical protein
MIKTSETIAELATALMGFQQQMTTLKKDSQGYGYKYISFDAVTDAIRAPLAAVGLAYTQIPTIPPVEFTGHIALTTRLMHISGEWIEETMIMPVPQVGKANEAQCYGAGLQYARRYALSSILGIAADEDVDAAPQPPPRKKAAPQFEDIHSANPQSNGARMPTEKMRKAFYAIGNELYGPDWETKRKELIIAATNREFESARNLTYDQMSRLIDGMKKKLEG